jgi:dTDP-4-amino-4,6-dideoxygalactose transaminase
MTYSIPFNIPTWLGKEEEAIAAAIAGRKFSGDGPWTQRCHTLLQETLGVPKALLTTSCTHALEMAAILLDIQPGDEVIVPSFTFVTSINAFVLRGARPVFVDVRPDTLNIDERLIEAAITPATKAIVVVHYAGVACAMDTIMQIAARHGVPVVEDNAHGLFGKYRGRWLGTLGALATQSFHETKNFQCGEGGALLINDARYAERAEIIREKGTNRSRFFRGQVDKYSWVDVGSSYLLSDLLAAGLSVQLEARKTIQDARCALWERYDRELGEWAAANGMTTPTVPDGCEQAYHMYYLLLPSLEARTALIEHLKAQGILAVFHYLPLHLSEMGVRLGGRAGDCPVTESISDRLLRLPFYTNMTADEQSRVVEAVKMSQGVARVV